MRAQDIQETETELPSPASPRKTVRRIAKEIGKRKMHETIKSTKQMFNLIDANEPDTDVFVPYGGDDIEEEEV